MILFYSDYCAHSRMLIETIKNYDKEHKLIKIVSIDVLRKKGKKLPSNITSVPSLLIMPEKVLKVGKQVFDYLLLPGSGLLLKPPVNTDNLSNTKSKNNEPIGKDLISFSFSSGGTFSDNYSLIEDDKNNSGFVENNYMWANISDDEIHKSPENVLPIQEETRKQRDLLDLDQLRIQRDLDLKESDLNKTELPISTDTRNI